MTTAEKIAGRRANGRRSGGWIRREKRLAIYARDEWRCAYCGGDLAEAPRTLDHLHPRELGGSNVPRNLVTACLSCNSSKKALPLRRFLERLPDRDNVAARIRRLVRRVV